MLRRPTYRALTRQLQTLLAGVVMLCYLAANVEFDSLHELAHHEESTSHTAADESDPCHRQLHHNDFAKGCAHKTHLVAVKKCGLCDHNLSVDKTLDTTEILAAAHIVQDVYAFANHDVIHCDAIHIPARGPPAV